MDLPYLDLVVHESLRLNPPLTFSNRECSENIELEAVRGNKILIEKGLRVFIPTLSIQHDPGELKMFNFKLNLGYHELETISSNATTSTY